jgi:hypothetical protein
MEEFAKKRLPYRRAVRVLLLTTILAVIGVGWLIRYAPVANSTRLFLGDAHISLALAGAALLVVELFLGIFARKKGTSEFAIPFRRTKIFLLSVAYISFVLMIITGYGRVALAPAPFRLWGETIPIWRYNDAPLAALVENLLGFPPQMFGWENLTLSEALGASHWVISIILAAAVVAYIGVVLLTKLFPGRSGARRPAAESPEAALESQGRRRRAPALIMAKSLAQKVRFVGWLNLLLQLLLAFASGLLLQFARSGRAFGPATPWLGASLSWAACALVLLCFSIFLTYFYIRSSKKIVAHPEYYLDHRNILAFWFLALGLVTGALGGATSFVGVLVSIWMLIAKVVSQPPGIAIMNPANFIRMLDILVLIVNIMLLLAHTLGVGSSLWLSVRTSKARLSYLGAGPFNDRNDRAAVAAGPNP